MVTIQLTNTDFDEAVRLAAHMHDLNHPAFKMYKELVTLMQNSIIADGDIVVTTVEERLCDTLDRAECHNINIANRPSERQLAAHIAQKKDRDD